MPQRNVTVYSLLVSCPNDVENMVPIISRVVSLYNITQGEQNNAFVNVEYWKDASYPDSGESAQNIINKEFSDDCDFCVAILWTRFGTSTDKYASGTEEEIENKIAEGKHVMLYFVNKAIEPSMLEADQYNKVNQYKEKYSREHKGSYCEVQDDIDFERKFSCHLVKMMTSIIKDNLIKQCQGANGSHTLKVSRISKKLHTNFSKGNKLSDLLYQSIDGLINEIMGLTRSLKYVNSNSNVYRFGNEIYDIPVKISTKDQKRIRKYCKERDFIIDDVFFDLPDLMISECNNNEGLKGPTYMGNAVSESKCNDFDQLIILMDELDQCDAYFNELDQLYIMELYIENEGATYDEDLEVTLRFPQGMVVEVDDFPVPESYICDSVTSIIGKDIFTMPKSYEYDDYSEYITWDSLLKKIDNKSLKGTITEDIKTRDRRLYKDELENWFIYDVFTDEQLGEEIWRFHIDSLNPHQKMYFPSRIYFKDIPYGLRYEINSKHLTETCIGTIEI